ncbi:WD40 repeat [Pyrenophora tritici-repentis]|nr:WD40 repeat [Pyrenophora tritici-repentis]
MTVAEWPSSMLRHDTDSASHRDGLVQRCRRDQLPVWREGHRHDRREWPSSVLRHDPVAASHSRTVLSKDADATSCPSGEKTTAQTVEEWPSSVLRHASQSASLIDNILTFSGTWSTKVCRTRLLSGANTSAE